MAGLNFFVRNGLQANTNVIVGNSTVNAVVNSTCLLFTGGVSLNTASIATSANFLANVASKFLTVDQYWGAGAYTSLTDAATIAVDLSTGINFTVTIAGNRTLGWPSNMKIGQSGFIEVVEDGSGSRTLSFFSNSTVSYKFDTGTAPSIDTAANHKSVLAYHVRSTSVVYLTMPLQGAQ